MDVQSNNIETKLIHCGEPQPRLNGAVVLPIYQSAMFEYSGEQSYHDIKYIRLNNTPNHIAVQEKLASLENAEAALVASSGMAAITTTLLAILSSGDHFLIQNGIYGGTHNFITDDLPQLGISCDFIDGNDPGSWPAKLKPNTKAIYVETMGNPLLTVSDLRAAVNFAQENGLLSLVDNTFASPYNFRAVEFGFDLSLHSCTKYLNGHSDIVAGAVLGREELIEKITHKLNHLGGSLDPHACFLLHRGMKTLAVRMKQHNFSGLILAEFLSRHPAVSQVNYPGLKTHPMYEQSKDWFTGFSGMLSFEMKDGLEAAERFIANTNLLVKAPSLGGVESLVTRPATTSHAGMSSEDRQKLGITDSLIRVSIGIESTEDLLADFEQALG